MRLLRSFLFTCQSKIIKRAFKIKQTNILKDLSSFSPLGQTVCLAIRSFPILLPLSYRIGFHYQIFHWTQFFSSYTLIEFYGIDFLLSFFYSLPFFSLLHSKRERREPRFVFSDREIYNGGAEISSVEREKNSPFSYSFLAIFSTLYGPSSVAPPPLISSWRGHKSDHSCSEGEKDMRLLFFLWPL